MVAKNKDSDNKYVILLAETIVKPFIKKYISGNVSDIEEVPYNQSDQGSTKSPFQCPRCDKVLKTLSGLRSHDTKVHKKRKDFENETTKHTEDVIKPVEIVEKTQLKG